MSQMCSGAVGPLKKVARDAAVRHVKASRKAALAKGLKKKDAIRKITTQAATDAVKKLLEEQDKMVCPLLVCHLFVCPIPFLANLLVCSTVNIGAFAQHVSVYLF